ncbi:hypothetical protein PN499_14085 [Kamptonema animale CS-326]|jgi:hypothetical protein|uniref:hypothetical protein n=1 Tax=Kamptonema animale TaxID=92934 RepID=UPI00232B5261|nr:hypothetical protein [Kamptonema animale]MDB9512317.1 hypothetical protein [Kamptonema animale CS-326]
MADGILKFNSVSNISVFWELGFFLGIYLQKLLIVSNDTDKIKVIIADLRQVPHKKGCSLLLL